MSESAVSNKIVFSEHLSPDEDRYFHQFIEDDGFPAWLAFIAARGRFYSEPNLELLAHAMQGSPDDKIDAVEVCVYIGKALQLCLCISRKDLCKLSVNGIFSNAGFTIQRSKFVVTSGWYETPSSEPDFFGTPLVDFELPLEAYNIIHWDTKIFSLNIEPVSATDRYAADLYAIHSSVSTQEDGGQELPSPVAATLGERGRL